MKAASDLNSPVSGTVVKVNDAVADEPASINQDAFQSWMICIEISNAEELTDLMNSAEYEEFCGKEA